MSVVNERSNIEIEEKHKIIPTNTGFWVYYGDIYFVQVWILVSHHRIILANWWVVSQTMIEVNNDVNITLTFK